MRTGPVTAITPIVLAPLIPPWESNDGRCDEPGYWYAASFPKRYAYSPLALRAMGDPIAVPPVRCPMTNALLTHPRPFVGEGRVKGKVAVPSPPRFATQVRPPRGVSDE